MTYSTAMSLTLPCLTSDHRQQLLQEKPLLSLYEVFATIPDPRSRHGRRYELPFLLICIVAALLCNCDSTLAIGQWCRDQRYVLSRLFGKRPFLCPSDSLLRKLLPRLHAEQIEWALADWIRMTLHASPDDPIALDGKTVRGAGNADHPAPHLLSFRTHQSQETLLQVAVCEKTNEIPIAQALLPCLPLQGRVCTADALHTQKEFMLAVDARGGKTVLTVKNNQPTLYADLATYFADPHASFEQSSTLDQHRGRIETRSIRVSTEMNAYLTDWPLIQQVAELTRTVTVRQSGKISREVVYLITPLTAQEAGPSRLLELVRGHWSIENSSHYVRDVTFGEDRSRLRTAYAPHIMATLRNLAITLIHRSGSSHIAATRRHFASHPRRAFALLLPSKFPQQ
jgi:predicted transposase YbfD/YdcC